MAPGPDNQDLGRLLAYSQVGFEIAGPVAVGAVLDYYLHWTPAPWAVVVGAVVGLVGGLYHLVQMLNRDEQGPPPSGPGREGP